MGRLLLSIKQVQGGICLRNKCQIAKLITLCLLSIYLLSACSNTEKGEKIEVFVIKTLEHETGDYKKVNSVLNTEESKNYIKFNLVAIEDFYDIDGNYIKTEILHSKYEKSKVTLEQNAEDKKVELQEPSTILISENSVKNFRGLDYMTKEEKEKVKEHVLSFIDMF